MPKMIIIYPVCNENDAQQALLSFALKRSDMVSFSRYYKGPLDDKVALKDQPAEIQHVLAETKKDLYTRLDYYRRVLGLETEAETISYIDGMINQDDECFKEDAQPSNLQRVIPITKEQHLALLAKRPEEERARQEAMFMARTPTLPEYLGKWYTHISPVTLGPLFEVTYYRIGGRIESLILGMQSIDEYYDDGHFRYEDLAFYYDGKPVLEICSHEQEAFLPYDQKTHEELEWMGIEYTISEFR